MSLFKNTFAVAVGIAAFCLSEGAWASRSSVGIMSPRNVVNVDKDYTYGYTYLPGDALDVYETPNRRIGWTVNYDYLDKNLLRPVSVAYVDYVPEVIRVCLSNAHQNLREVNNTVNNLLVARPLDSGTSALRFGINSTVGLLGCIDVAKYMGLERKRMSMDTVLGKWGVDQGAYVVIPGLGIGTYRSYIGSAVDTLYFPFTYFPLWVDGILWGFNAVDSRAATLDQDEVLRNSLDPYSQARDFYLMYQEGLVSGTDATSSVDENDENLEQYMDEIDE
ncbi:VacJ family lipoprotein [uncultured Ruminobacter sp.]|jgi:phospholipid-binding lipoprotein MlaA|uniref:MlaA family lipoprotein n=1 Tax=Ruminobacter sp. TaxID=2774296 RepID=UPI0025DF68C1|nr:VacJ family lipoprotein [uncultured Ruminobacter sp.]